MGVKYTPMNRRYSCMALNMPMGNQVGQISRRWEWEWEWEWEDKEQEKGEGRREKGEGRGENT